MNDKYDIEEVKRQERQRCIDALDKEVEYANEEWRRARDDLDTFDEPKRQLAIVRYTFWHRRMHTYQLAVEIIRELGGSE